MSSDALPGVTVWPLDPPWYLIHDIFSDTLSLVDRYTLTNWIRDDAALTIARQWAKDKVDVFRM